MWLTIKPRGMLQCSPTALQGLLGCAWSMLPPSPRLRTATNPSACIPYSFIVLYSQVHQELGRQHKWTLVVVCRIIS